MAVETVIVPHFANFRVFKVRLEYLQEGLEWAQSVHLIVIGGG